MSGFKNINIGDPVTAFGDLRTTQLSPLFQGSFEYTVLNTAINTNTVTGSGTVTQATGMAVVGTGTTTASYANLKSYHPAKYRAGLGGMTRFTALFTTPVAATEQYIGLADEIGTGAVAFKNGYTIGYTGTTFQIQRWANDVLAETIDISSFDDVLADIDFTKLNVFQIQYQYLGGGNIYFSIEDPTTGRFRLFHTLKYANLHIVPSTYNPNYRFQIYADNLATTSNISISCGSYSYFVEGYTKYLEIHQPQHSTGLKSKAAVTTEVALVTIKNKLTYPTALSKTNYTMIMLERLAGNIDNNATTNVADIRIVKNATLGGTPSYTDIDASNSCVSFDVAGTTVTGGTTLFSTSLIGKNDKIAENLTDYVIFLAPGETITVAAASVNSATIKSSLLWKELF